MISLQKNFLFINIPKTAGNSIQSCLEKYSEDKLEKVNDDRFEVKNNKFSSLTKHSTLSAYKKLIDEKTYNSLFKFCVIRNPFDRAISYYFSPNFGFSGWNENVFINRILNKEMSDIRTFITTNHLSKLSDEMNYILKFENINSDFNVLLQQLKIDDINTLIRINKSNHEHYRYYYSNKLKDLVYEKFKEEIDFFAYEF